MEKVLFNKTSNTNAEKISLESDINPTSFKIFKKHNIIIEKHYGPISFSCIIDLIKNMELNEDFSVDFNYLIDIRNCTFEQRSNKIQELITHITVNYSYLMRRKIAIIAKTNEQYSMASIFKTLCPNDPKNIHIFTYIDEAAIWLNPDINIKDLNKSISNYIV